MTGRLAAYAAVAGVVGLFCIVMPVRWLGYNPVTRQHNPRFDAAKAASNMWIVRLAGALLLILCGSCIWLAV